VQSLRSKYEASLEAWPLQTKALTSFVGLIVADLVAQLADAGPWDPLRTARMAAFGLCWHGISVRAPDRPTAWMLCIVANGV
jgi:hypothetical protein